MRSPDPRTSLGLTAQRLDAARAEPLLASVGVGHMVEIPQRAIRQPRRKQGKPKPPLIEMLAAGRGAAEVRLRLYLWLWASLSTREFGNLDLKRTTGEWAELLDVMPEGATHNQGKRAIASRRVARAQAYLQDQGLVARPEPDVLRLLDPDGSGRDYRPWSEDDVREREREQDRLEDFYAHRTDLRRSQHWEMRPLRLPASLWTNGTISALPATALVALLILWDLEDEPGTVTSVRKSRPYEYPMSHDSWTRGTATLTRTGFVHRHNGALVLPASNANPKVTEDRYRVRWAIDHERLTAAGRRTR